jgi:hypothetical protein
MMLVSTPSEALGGDADAVAGPVYSFDVPLHLTLVHFPHGPHVRDAGSERLGASIEDARGPEVE